LGRHEDGQPLNAWRAEQKTEAIPSKGAGRLRYYWIISLFYRWNYPVDDWCRII